jgi:hypothetical protein
LQGTIYRLVVHFDASIPVGTAGLSLVSEASGVRVPVWVDLFETIQSKRTRRVA